MNIEDLKKFKKSLQKYLHSFFLCDTLNNGLKKLPKTVGELDS